MRLKLLYSFFLFVLFLTFYFSWISDPRLEITGVLPKWVTDWTDIEQNETIRTAIPFLILGVLMGIYLSIRTSPTRYWWLALLIFLFVVSLAELGQLFLPLRNCDILDILWGVTGSGLGLLLIYPFKNAFDT